MAMFSPIIARYPPNYLASFIQDGKIRVPPSSKYLFGTDYIGHDVFSQIVYGASTALYVGFGAAAIAMSLAIVVGLVSGYYGGLVDNLLMRITEIFLVIPFLLILLVFLQVVTSFDTFRSWWSYNGDSNNRIVFMGIQCKDYSRRSASC